MPVRRLGVIALILLTAACGPPRPPWADGRMIRTELPEGAAPQDLRNLQQRLLTLHNRERAGIGAPPLTWDMQLASAAAAYGPSLARSGSLAHSEPQTRPGQGENLWMGTRGAYALDEMIDSWAAEQRLFRPGIFPNVSTSGHGADVAHYTQMIWPATTRVGCALHQAREWDFLVCRYAPPGNVVGQSVP